MSCETNKGGIKSIRFATEKEERSFMDNEGYLFKNCIISKEGDQILHIPLDAVKKACEEFQEPQLGLEESKFYPHTITFTLNPSTKPYWEHFGYKSEQEMIDAQCIINTETGHCYKHGRPASECFKK